MSVQGHDQRCPGLAQAGQSLPGRLVPADRYSGRESAVRGVGHALAGALSIHAHHYLFRVAEQFRNTYSHGAFGREGRASMVVHLPGVGDVPVILDEFGVRPELLFVPAVKDDFDKICAVFDSCDDWLANGPLADGHRWVAAGLDFQFDARFRASLAAARAEGRFEEFLNEEALYVDAVMNWEI